MTLDHSGRRHGRAATVKPRVEGVPLSPFLAAQPAREYAQGHQSDPIASFQGSAASGGRQVSASRRTRCQCEPRVTGLAVRTGLARVPDRCLGIHRYLQGITEARRGTHSLRTAGSAGVIRSTCDSATTSEDRGRQSTTPEAWRGFS
jgi:hypothetical protein